MINKENEMKNATMNKALVLAALRDSIIRAYAAGATISDIKENCELTTLSMEYAEQTLCFHESVNTRDGAYCKHCGKTLA